MHPLYNKSVESEEVEQRGQDTGRGEVEDETQRYRQRQRGECSAIYCQQQQRQRQALNRRNNDVRGDIVRCGWGLGVAVRRERLSVGW
jgi:hypothetical protein